MFDTFGFRFSLASIYIAGSVTRLVTGGRMRKKNGWFERAALFFDGRWCRVIVAEVRCAD
jgi:hypothetical protein